MNVLHVVHNYWPAIGGSERLIQGISEGLVQRDHRVTVLTSTAYTNDAYTIQPDLPLMPPGEEEVNGVRVRRFNMYRQHRWTFGVIQGLFWRFRLPGNDIVRALWTGPLSWQWLQAARHTPADLVTGIPFPMASMYYAYAARRRQGIPLVYIPCTHAEDRWGFDRPIADRVTRRAEAVLALTTYEKDYLIQRGVDAGRVHVIGAGVDAAPFANLAPDSFRQAHGIGTDPVVLFVGQQAHHKGIDLLIEAMPAVWAHVPDAWLVIAGAPTLFTQRMRDQLIPALSPGQQRRVLVIERFSEEDKPLIYASADVFASISSFESFGIVYLEAWLAGKPVIGCRVGAVASLIDEGVDGLLVDRDAGQVAEAILRLLRDPATRRRMGERGREKVLSRYTWDRVVDRVEGIYRGLTAQTPNSTR